MPDDSPHGMSTHSDYLGRVPASVLLARLEGLLRDADLIFLPDPLAQNDYATADHAVYRRYKRCALLVIESRRLAGSLAVYHPIGPCALNRSTRHTQLAASRQPYPCSLARMVRRSLVAS